MTYAIIQTGGKQYRVAPGEKVEIEKLPIEVGQKVQFDQVLMIGGEGSFQMGNPFVPKAQVVGEVVEQGKGKKITIIRYKKRKGYDKKQGHRQLLTTVEIKEIRG